jgi:hypothetical protein
MSLAADINLEEDILMKISRTLTALFGLAIFFAAYLPTVRADEWDKTTKVTFSEPVQVPGKVLPAGTYVFKLLDSQSNRHIVQIYNADHTSLITTVLAIPNERLEPAGKTVLLYEERPADQPVALAAWFYPGDSFGQEFVYPKSESEQLARLNNRKVPSTDSEEAYPSLKERNTEAARSPTPAPRAEAPNPPAEAAAAPPPEPKPAPPARTEMAQNRRSELPHTASSLPLIGFLGVTLLGFALLLRVALRA